MKISLFEVHFQVMGNSFFPSFFNMWFWIIFFIFLYTAECCFSSFFPYCSTMLLCCIPILLIPCIVSDFHCIRNLGIKKNIHLCLLFTNMVAPVIFLYIINDRLPFFNMHPVGQEKICMSGIQWKVLRYSGVIHSLHPRDMLHIYVVVIPVLMAVAMHF